MSIHSGRLRSPAVDHTCRCRATTSRRRDKIVLEKFDTDHPAASTGVASSYTCLVGLEEAAFEI